MLFVNHYFARFLKNFPCDKRRREMKDYRYLAVETFTPGPMVDTTVQDLIY